MRPNVVRLALYEVKVLVTVYAYKTAGFQTLTNDEAILDSFLILIAFIELLFSSWRHYIKSIFIVIQMKLHCRYLYKDQLRRMKMTALHLLPKIRIALI